LELAPKLVLEEEETPTTPQKDAAKDMCFVLDPQIERKENLSLSFSFSIFGARALKSVCFTKVLLPLVAC